MTHLLTHRHALSTNPALGLVAIRGASPFSLARRSTVTLGDTHNTISCSAPLRCCRLLFLQLLFELRRREIHPSPESEHLRTPFHLHPALPPLLYGCTYLIGLHWTRRQGTDQLPHTERLDRTASHHIALSRPPGRNRHPTPNSRSDAARRPQDKNTYTAAVMAQTGAGGSYNNPLKKFK